MIDFLVQAHSSWRWPVLILILIIAIKALIGWSGHRKWTGLDTNLLVLSRIAIYIQVLLGIALYILLQKWSAGMAFAGEHAVPMILAVGGVEFSAARAKKSRGRKKFIFAFIGFTIALVLIFWGLATVGGIFA